MSSEHYSKEPDFEEKTTQKLAHYYYLAQWHLKKINSLQPTNDGLRPYWKAAEQAWYANPTENPTIAPPKPITIRSVHVLYAKCDRHLNMKPNTIVDHLNMFFAANAGAQFIHNVLLHDSAKPHRLRFKISNRATAISREKLGIVSSSANRSKATAHALAQPGYVFGHYLDRRNSSISRTIRVKDHGSSALKGEYYIVTTDIEEDDDNGANDEEVPTDMMEQWLAQRV